ncbi:hypothetical protein GBA52_002461 [Prunus armeniaca]|nr:hypothetical protein GBA52_002461 [Prunus armeniaca]
MESTKLLLFFFFFFLHLITASSSSQPLFPKQAHPTKSGYLPVKPTTGSAIFYTFYEAQNLTISPDLSQTPLLIWLQGGPGCSSMIGNFFELGPWRVNFNKHPSEPLALEPNSGSWNRIFGLVFLDNPIGTGFSIAAKPEEIPRDQLSVARDLFVAITKFIELDPVFKSRPLYITGESYAGKYVPAIGYYILKRNAELAAGSQGVNLHGVAIGDGLTDPEIQVATHDVNAYFSGLINERQRSELEKLQVEAVGFTKAGNWTDRKVWKVGGEVAGYVQKWGSLSHVLVSEAGHLLPADQPLRAQAMIEDWVLDKGLFGNAREVNLSSNFDM